MSRIHMVLSRALAIGLAATATNAWAQNYDRVAPKQPPAQQPRAPQSDAMNTQAAPTNASVVVVPALKGLVFVAGREMVKPEGVMTEGVVTNGLPPIQGAEFNAAANGYLGKPVTLGQLQEITELVTKAYRAAGRPMVRAVVPQQNVDSGVIQIVVMEFRVGKIEVEGNEHFTAEQVAAPFRFERGDVISSPEVAQALDEANSNPFRRVELVYKPSAEPGYADLVLETRDRFPFRPYVTYDNSGPVSVGRSRLGAGFSWGKAFGADQILAYQFTASSDIFGGSRTDGLHVTSFMSHSAYWSAPVFNGDRIVVFGAYERSRPDIGSNFGLIGKSAQASIRYQHRLPGMGNLRSKLELGFDFKTTNNNLDFGGTRVSSQQTHIAQFLLSWNASLPDSMGVTSLAATVVWSPGGLTAHNNDADFQPSLTHGGRPGAEASYFYARGTLDRLTILPGGASLASRLVGQISNKPLLETEQLSLGGIDTLRGYEPNSVNADQGVFFSNELRSPSVTVAKDSRLYALLFVDAAKMWNKFGLPGQVKDYSAVSAGGGLRLNIATNVVAKGDFGWQLKRLPNQKRLGQLGTLSITIGY